MTGNGLHFLTEGLGRYKTNTVTNRPEMALVPTASSAGTAF